MGSKTTKSTTSKSLLVNKLKSQNTDSEKIKEKLSNYSSPQYYQDTFFNDKTILEGLKYEDKNTGEDGLKLLKVKLVLIDLDQWRQNKKLAAIFANVGKLVDFQRYGLVHAGIQIGSYIIHWFNDSIVHFTNIASASPKLALDVGAINCSNQEELKEKTKSLSELIVLWNTQKKYTKKCNCHHFTDDLLEVLGMRAEFKGQIYGYIQKLKTKGTVDMEWTNPINGTTVIFSTHKDLDVYAGDLFLKHPDFETKHPYDFYLIKAFDRAFWIGKYKPVSENMTTDERKKMYNEYKCPFGDPFETQSFL